MNSMNLLQNFFQKLILKVSRIKTRFVKNLLINLFKNHYKISLEEFARKNMNEYSSFNDFFTREFDEGVRPIDQTENTIVSPVDGKVMESGRVSDGKLFQLKNMEYNLSDLLNKNPQLIEAFKDAFYVTIYLAPYNYHRVHIPHQGKLLHNEIIDGKTYKVNEQALRKIDALYTKNARQISQFESSKVNYCIIMVGAMNVSSISITDKNKEVYNKGDEFAHFNLGSTVLMLFSGSENIKFPDGLRFGEKIKLGECIAKFR